MSTRSGRTRSSIVDSSPSRTRKVASPTRSPARNRKSSVERNSVRQSPSRKSPSRKPVSKYPARRSPSRTVKDKETTETVPKSPAKRPAINSNVEIKLEDFSTKFEIYRSTRSKRSEYSIKDITTKTQLVEEENVNGSDSIDSISDYGLRNRRSVENIVPRRSSRLREFVDNVPDIRRSLSKSVSKSISNSVSKSIDTYSDEDIPELATIREKSASVIRKLSTPVPSSVNLAHLNNKFEFGGRIGSGILVLILPVISLAVLLSCSQSCAHNVLLNLQQYKSITTWLSAQSAVIVISQYILQALILVLPILGVKQVDDSGKRYCFNALCSSIITISILFALQYYKLFKTDIVLNSYFQLAFTSYLIATILAIYLLIKSWKIDENNLNPYGKTGHTLYDFFIGREIHPQVRRFNIKLWTYRACNITTLVLLLLLFKNSFNIQEKDAENKVISIQNYKDLFTKVQWKPTLFVFTMMQIIYTLNFIVKEYKVISTFYWQYEGLGYMQLTASALYPFYFTSISKYLVDSELTLRTNTLIAASSLFSLGFIIMYFSNNIKYEFRKNPLNPSLAHLDSMPTFHGKKLLVSNLWGLVRHPNYTGDILIHIALALPGILSSRLLAAAPALSTIIVLLHRAWRDHDRCRRRYGAAWQRYCKRVPAVVLPKIL